MIALVYCLLGLGGLGFRRGVLGHQSASRFFFRMGMGFDFFRCGGLFLLGIRLGVSRRVRCGSRIERECRREGKQAEGEGGLQFHDRVFLLRVGKYTGTSVRSLCSTLTGQP
jgi:hypothetical protein